MVPCEDLYYTSQELKKQRQDDEATNRNSKTQEDDLFSFRGLERSHHSVERRRHIQEFVQSVLEVQREQQEFGLARDDYELFMVASANSKKDRIKAQRMGTKDAFDAMSCCMGDSTSSISTTASGTSVSSQKRRKSLKERFSGSFSKLKSNSKRLLLGKEVSLKRLSFRKTTAAAPAC